ncbi:EamA family transporter [Nonomuraea cavernae]|uniref:EamA family transporter n=1 Tax=Nonomuraea cavernae TaxID=2045107 RepID=UPI0033EA6AF0
MGPNTADRRTSLMVWGALAIVYVVWGSTYLGIGIAIESIPPMLSAAIRFIVAATLLSGFLLVRSGPAAFRMSRRQFLGAALVGVLLLTTGNGMLTVAEQYISTGLAALLVASVPLWLVVFRFAVRDRPKTLTLAGVLVGIGGVGALSLTGAEDGSGVGIVVVLLASVSWAVGSFVSGRIAMPANALATSAVEMIVGGAGLLVLGTGFGERLDVSAVTTRSWLALAYLIVAGSLIGFTAFSWLLGNAPISLVSTYAYVNPAVAVALGALVLSEPITVQVIVGGLVILVGVALVISTERKGTTRAPDAAAGDGGTPPPARQRAEPVIEQRGV